VTVAPAPERTCIGCRRKRGQAELVRLANEAGRVVAPLAPVRRGGARICAPNRRVLRPRTNGAHLRAPSAAR